jgi:hypothetical protein
MKKFAFAMVFTLAVAGYALAEEFTASIMKVDTAKGTITYQKKKKGEADGDAVTVSVAKTVKIANGKKDMENKGKFLVGDEIKDGLKDDMFTKAGDKGVNARITVADDGADKGKVTQILVVKGGKKGGGQ